MTGGGDWMIKESWVLQGEVYSIMIEDLAVARLPLEVFLWRGSVSTWRGVIVLLWFRTWRGLAGETDFLIIVVGIMLGLYWMNCLWSLAIGDKIFGDLILGGWRYCCYY